MTEQVSLSSNVSTKLRYHLNYIYILSMLDLRLDHLIFFPLCQADKKPLCGCVAVYTATFSKWNWDEIYKLGNLTDLNPINKIPQVWPSACIHVCTHINTCVGVCTPAHMSVRYIYGCTTLL